MTYNFLAVRKTAKNIAHYNHHVLGHTRTSLIRPYRYSTILSSHDHLRRYSFQPKKALVLGKVSRYEFEKMRHKGFSEAELDRVLLERGSKPDLMRQHHEIHESAQLELVNALKNHKLDVKLIKRFDYTDEVVKWADVIFTAGGDGTFLMGASKLLNPKKPIVGINTDPTRSAGYLCLPKEFSEKPKKAVDLIMQGSFSWSMRKRLRITLIGDKEKVWEPPLELHNMRMNYPEYRYVELMNEQTEDGDHPLKDHSQSKRSGASKSKNPRRNSADPGRRTLPVLALNEVYMGESLSSRVSYLEVQFNKDDQFYKTRNSGICVSTGTGSTSWTYNICKLTELSVSQVMKLINETTGTTNLNPKDHALVREITNKFNNNIVFNADEHKMAYTIRDPVYIGHKLGNMDTVSRGLVSGMEVKSRCFDAHLVIDGGLSFRFNDGTKAIIEMMHDDDLRTMILH